MAQHSRVRASLPDRAAALEYFATHRMFGVLPGIVLADLVHEVEEQRYSEGCYLFRAGDTADRVLAIRSGVVALVEDDERGNTRTVTLFSAGDTPGYALTLLGCRWTWSGVALTDTEVLAVRKETFDSLYNRFPQLAHQIILELLRQQHRSQWLAVRNTSTSVASRVAAYLLGRCSATGDAVSPGLSLDLALNRQHLALLLGTTRETVTRTLCGLSEAQLISLSGRIVRILQPHALHSLAGEAAEGRGTHRDLLGLAFGSR